MTEQVQYLLLDAWFIWKSYSFFMGKRYFFFISEMLLETNSSPTSTPLFPLPFAESEAALVYRWHLREALRSLRRARLAHISGETFLHSN